MLCLGKESINIVGGESALKSHNAEIFSQSKTIKYVYLQETAFVLSGKAILLGRAMSRVTPRGRCA